MFEVLITGKDGSSEKVYMTNSYDKALNRYVKEVTKYENEHLEKDECITVEIVSNELVLLEREIKG